MTDVQAYVKYSPSTIDVSASVVKRLDIWRTATDGIGRYKLLLKNDLGVWIGQFLADDPVQIKIENVLFLEGYLDIGLPISESRESILEQYYEMVGRDYGQDLQKVKICKTKSLIKQETGCINHNLQMTLLTTCFLK